MEVEHATHTEVVTICMVSVVTVTGWTSQSSIHPRLCVGVKKRKKPAVMVRWKDLHLSISKCSCCLVFFSGFCTSHKKKIEWNKACFLFRIWTIKVVNVSIHLDLRVLWMLRYTAIHLGIQCCRCTNYATLIILHRSSSYAERAYLFCVLTVWLNMPRVFYPTSGFLPDGM